MYLFSKFIRLKFDFKCNNSIFWWQQLLSGDFSNYEICLNDIFSFQNQPHARTKIYFYPKHKLNIEASVHHNIERSATTFIILQLHEMPFHVDLEAQKPILLPQ